MVNPMQAVVNTRTPFIRCHVQVVQDDVPTRTMSSTP